MGGRLPKTRVGLCSSMKISSKHQVHALTLCRIVVGVTVRIFSENGGDGEMVVIFGRARALDDFLSRYKTPSTSVDTHLSI